MHRARRFAALTAITISLFVTGCTNRPEQWGVMLWSPDESVYETGAVVPIYETSNLNRLYTLTAPKTATPITVELWRVSAFKRSKEAEAYAETYSDYASLYGEATLDGLRVRSDPDAEAAQLYKLRNHEVVKIISRNDEVDTVGEYEGHWYRVLTSSGVQGYTFDEYLQVGTMEDLRRIDDTGQTDEFLDRFFSTNFRPDYYRDMLRTGRYDLDRFLPEYGIFPDAKNQRIVIVTENNSTTIDYDRISRPTPDSYAFEPSSLIMTRHTENWINLIYTDGGQRYSQDFVYFPDDIDLLTIQELQRRGNLREDFIAHGSVLSSSAYGTITLSEDGSFVWDGYQRLVPDVVSVDASGMGTIDFPLYLDASLTDRYDGAVVFKFVRDTPDTVDVVRFLYAYDNGGVRFTFVPKSALEQNLIPREAPSSVILFFTFS